MKMKTSTKKEPKKEVANPLAWGELKKRVDTWTKWFITRGGDRAAEKDHRGACLARLPSQV